MEGFIRLYPKEAIVVSSGDFDMATRLVKKNDSVVFPPARFVYRLISADPEFAALLVERLYYQGEDELVMETLTHFAYDADRLAAVPALPISLEKGGRFLESLLEEMGREWLQAQILEAIRVYAGRMEPGDFLQRPWRRL